MELKNAIKKAGQELLDLLFPKECLVCGAEKTFLCENCLANLPRLEKQQCLVCQTPSAFGKTHINCVSKNTVDGIISALPYRDKNISKIIETFKYNFVYDLSMPLSHLIASEVAKQNLSDYFQNFTIIPVPLHARRFNWRGFNQAELLAKQLSEDLGIPIDPNLVTRAKFTKPQTRLSHDQRKKNIQNAFVLNHLVTDKKFLLVDDVVTTGSTLNEIAKLLKHAEAEEVWALTAAHG